MLLLLPLVGCRPDDEHAKISYRPAPSTRRLPSAMGVDICVDVIDLRDDQESLGYIGPDKILPKYRINHIIRKAFEKELKTRGFNICGNPHRIEVEIHKCYVEFQDVKMTEPQDNDLAVLDVLGILTPTMPQAKVDAEVKFNVRVYSRKNELIYAKEICGEAKDSLGSMGNRCAGKLLTAALFQGMQILFHDPMLLQSLTESEKKPSRFQQSPPQRALR